MECPRCGNEMENGRCMWCAYETKDTSGNDKSDLEVLKNKFKTFLFIITISSFTIFLSLCIIVLAGHISVILPETFVHKTVIYVVLVFVVPIAEVGGYYFVAYTIFLIISVLVSFAYLLYLEGSRIFLYYKSDSRVKKKKFSLTDSPISRLAFTFSALLFIYYTYLIILQMLGITFHTPGIHELELWQMIYSLTRASVWEEITIRVVFIGLPMTIYAVLNDKTDLKRYILGGFGTKDRFVIWPILFSSSIFAFAHLASWDLYKLPPTFLAGLVFGYLFAKDGLYSCILFHFAWNFTSVFNKLSPSLGEVVSIFIIITLFLGVYFSYMFTKKAIVWLIRPVSEIRQPKVSEEEEGHKTTGVEAAFVCSDCGNHTALYTKEGKLKCKHCGKESDPMSSESQKKLNAPEIKREWPPSK